MIFFGNWNIYIYYSKSQHASLAVRVELSNLSQFQAVLLLYFSLTIV